MFIVKPKKSKTLFSFQKLNKYFILPFLVPIICFSTKFFSETMKTDNNKRDIKEVTADNTHTFVFLYQLIQSICLFLGGLLYFLSIHKTKSLKDAKNIEISKRKTEDFNLDNSIKYKIPRISREAKSSVKMSNIKKNIIIFIMPLLFITYNLGIAYGVKHPQLEKRIYFLFFITLINIFIFKKQIFSHQKLSLIITAIGIIPIFVAFGVYLNADEYYIFYDIFLLIGSFCYSLFLVFIKYITLNKGMNVFLLLLYQGLLGTLYTIIIYIAISFIVKDDFTYLYNIFICNEENFVCISHFYENIIFYFLLNTVLQTLIFLVVYLFSPELFAISDIFSPLFSFIALCIQIHETNVVKIVLTVIGYLIIAVGSFIYNELIVCNFCGFNENTWKAIDKKAQADIIGVDSTDSFAVFQNYEVDNEKFKSQGSVDYSDEEECIEMASQN